MTQQHSSENKHQFDNLPWHDSRLLEIRIRTSSPDSHEHSDLELKVDFITSRMAHRGCTVILRNCTIIKIDLDSAGMALSGQLIFGATCDADTNLRAKLEATQLAHEHSPLADYHHFQFGLIPPGGRLDVFGKSFEVKWDTE